MPISEARKAYMREYMREYSLTEKYKAYKNSDKYKASKQRSRDKNKEFRKTEDGRKLRRMEDKTPAAKARHSRYNTSAKRKFAKANGITGMAKAICHPNRLSVKEGLCSACHRNKTTKELSASYIRQLLRKQYERAGLKAPKITSDLIEAERAIVIVKRMIMEMKK